MLVNLLTKPGGEVVFAVDPRAVASVGETQDGQIILILSSGEKCLLGHQTPGRSIATIVAEINKHLP